MNTSACNSTTPADIFQQLVALSVPAHELPGGDQGYWLYQAGGYRWLCSPPGAIQCAMKLAAPAELVLPNHRAMLLAALLPGHCEGVLDLGTGGAGFVRAMGALAHQPQLSCVDMDPAMVSLARRFFNLRQDQAVHIEDAAAFLQRNADTYDVIFCDLFRGREAPAALLGKQFYSDLASRMSDDGAAAINTLPESEDQLREVIGLVRDCFAGVAVLGFEDLGNVVLLISNTELPSPGEWARRLGASPWAGDSMLPGCLARLVKA